MAMLAKRPSVERSQRNAAWAFLAPAFIVLVAFTFLPVLLALIASLFEVPVRGEWRFIGLGNYREAIADPAIRGSAWNTLVFSALAIPTSVLLGFGFALLVESFARGRALYRTLIFLPVTANLVAMAIVFQWLFSVRGGVVNEVLALVGVGPIDFLRMESTALPTLAAVGVWRFAAFNFVIYLAGLSAIPQSIHESAAIDGVRGLAKTTTIIWPLLRPSTVFATVITFIQAIQVFELVAVMTEGGPLGSTETWLFTIWQQGFQFFRLGYAAAISFVLLMAVVLAGYFRRRALVRGVN